MAVRPAPRALTVMKDYDSGARDTLGAVSRPRGTLSARCKRLEENMLTNITTLQYNRKGMEDVVNRRKEQAMKAQQEISQAIKAACGNGDSSGGAKSMFGIAPLNFTTMKERTAALEETAGRNQDTLMSCRTMLDYITDAKRTQKQEEETAIGARSDVGQAAPADRLDMIEANASMLSEKLQAQADSSTAEEDITRLNAEPVDFEASIKAQAEARQHYLFGIEPRMTMATASAGRPSSAPAGTRIVPHGRPASALSAASNFGRRPTSSIGGRPASSFGGRPASAAQPLSARSGVANVMGMPSRPCSANSMRSRIKAMEGNIARNAKTLTTNRDGLEVVKKRREQASQAMAQLMIDLKPVSS